MRNKYLRTIYGLTDGGEGSTKTSEVAEELDVSDASVSEAVSKLQDEGLVCKADYKGFTLSPIGKKKGKESKRIFEASVSFLRDKDVEEPERKAEKLIGSLPEPDLKKILSDQSVSS